MANLAKNIKNSDLLAAYQCKLDVPLSPIKSEKECEKLNNMIDSWIETRTKMKDKEAILIISETIKYTSKLVSDFESSYYNFEKVSPVEILRSLMDDHGLKQKDIAVDFGSQSIVSEVLRGKREISIAAAKNLGRRFSMSPTAFLNL